MKVRTLTNLLSSTASIFTPMSMCFIDGGDGEGSGGGSSGGESQSADGNADEGKASEAALSLEKEFSDPNETEEDVGASSEGNPGEDLGTRASDEADDDGEGGDADDGEGGEEGGEEGEGEDKEPPKKPSRMQERFDELTAQSRNHEREAEKWRSEALKLGFVEGGDQPTIPDEPDPDKYTYGEYDPDYLKDRGKYDAKVEMVQEQAKARFKAEASELDAKWTKNLAEKAEAYPDFDEVVVKGAENWACPPTIAIAIKDSDVGPDLAYQLAKDPAEALRISKLSPLEQAREFGRKESEFKTTSKIAALEAEIAKLKGSNEEDAGGKPKEKPRIVSKAPEPPRRRVGGGGARSETPADTDDFAAFERMADKKLGIQ